MIRYSHTQRSPLLPPLAVVVVTVIGAVAFLSGGGVEVAAVVLVAGSLIALVGLTMSRLTVDVADDHLRLAFGAGWPSKRIEFVDIASARAVRNRWWYGWGIRLTPVGLVWNVWGLDAVEFELASGRRFRIGTDEPRALLAALSGMVAIS